MFTCYGHNSEAQTVAKKAHDGAGDYRPREPGTWLKNVTKAHPRIRGGLGPTVVTAEKIFGWKNVHKQDDELIGKKQDKLCLTRRVSANGWAEAHLNGVEQRIMATWKLPPKNDGLQLRARPPVLLPKRERELPAV
jgi:hypothetical protein